MEPQPTLADLLQDEVNLAELSDEDLAARRAELDAASRVAAEGPITSEVTDLLDAATAHVGEIVAEQDTRAEIAAELTAKRDAALAKLDSFAAGPEDDETDEQPDDEGTEGDGETADEAETANATVEQPAPETTEVAAAVQAKPRRTINRKVTVPAAHRPQAARTTARQPIIRATGEVPGLPAGHRFPSIADAHKAMFERWTSLKGTAMDAAGLPHYMAQIDYSDQFAPEQVLGTLDPDAMAEQIMRYIDARRKGPEALDQLRVASGGVPGPAEPRYGQITYGQADRPLRDSLPQFLAPRGSIVFNSSPTLADIVLDTALGAIGTVTSAQDLAGATKDIQEITAPTPTTVTVEAETMRFSQGNFADRFYPERTAAFMKLGMVAYARHNDALRLTDIKTNCTKFTDTPAKFGAYRDLKRQFLGQTEELEDLVRDFEVPIVCLMPEYVPAMLAADILSQQPGDDAYGQTEERMRAEMEGWDPNVRFVWLKDSIRGRLSTSPSGQSPRSAGFDADVEWALYPEGAFAFADGGQLDLGILRDTTVSATNKFQTFYESWEALLPLVSSSLCFWMTSSLCADGASQLASAVNVCSPQGS